MGYELFDIRNDTGLLPIHRLGNECPRGTVDAVREEIRSVLELARGKDGEEKRAKARQFARQFATCWDEGGSSQKALGVLREAMG